MKIDEDRIHLIEKFVRLQISIVKTLNCILESFLEQFSLFIFMSFYQAFFILKN